MQRCKIESQPFEKIKKGINKLADVVSETLGPSGKNILIDKNFSPPQSTRDGITVAREINLTDRLENFGALLVRQAAENTNHYAGDGTSTATILARAIFLEGLKYIAAGYTPITIRREIEKTTAKIVATLKKNSRKIKSEKEVEYVATISANNDTFLGNLIAQGVNKVGAKGRVLVENANSNETSITMQEGMVVERGWEETSPYFVTDIKRKLIEYEDPEIAVIDDIIHDEQQLIPFVEHLAKSKRPLILFIKKVEENVVGWLILNKVKGKLPLAVLTTPGYNDSEIIEDLCNRIDARCFNPNWHSINSFSPDDLGTAKRIVIRRHDCSIVGGRGSVTERCTQLNAQIGEEQDPFQKELLTDRLNRLNSTIATIKVGALSETELVDKKLRIEDSINASQMALQDGIVPGGGIAYLRAIKQSNKVGDKILNAAIQTPFKTIIRNTGENVEKILAQVETTGYSVGYDAAKKVIVDLYDAGVIDPVGVTVEALERASSVASILLTTGSCLVSDEK